MRTGLHAVIACARVLLLPEEGRGYKTLQTEDRCKEKPSAVSLGLGKKSIHILIVHF